MVSWLEPFLTPRPVLDQGFLRLVRVDGDDQSIVEAARVTTGKGRSEHAWGEPDEVIGRQCKVCGLRENVTVDPRTVDLISLRTAQLARRAGCNDHCIEGDRRLIRYMLRHKHVSPFAFASITVHFRCPVYVFRQWVRHWSWPFQEYSMRYSEAVDAMQTTAPDAWRAQSSTNRQGSAGTVTEWPDSVEVCASPVGDGYEVHNKGPNDVDSGGLLWAPRLHNRAEVSPGAYLSVQERRLQEFAREVYQERLAFGVAKEQARKDLPLSNYTDVFATVRVRDLLPFLALRLDQHAQAEIRAYAEALAEIVKAWIPLTWEAFLDYQLEAVTFSGPEMRALRNFFEGAKSGHVDPAELLDVGNLLAMVKGADSRRLSARERAAFLDALGLETE